VLQKEGVSRVQISMHRSVMIKQKVLQCVTMRCSMLQRVVVCTARGGLKSASSDVLVCDDDAKFVAACCSMLQYVAACCSVLQCVAVHCSMLQCVAVRCNVLQCVPVRCMCCSVC